MEDTRTLQGQLGPTDNRKLDEYMTSIREIERQIEKSESERRRWIRTWSALTAPLPTSPNISS